MNLDDAKQEVLRMIGPEGQLVQALKNRGLAIYDWIDDGRIVIKFTIGHVLFDITTVQLDLLLCGQNVRLELQEWKCEWDSAAEHHDCFAIFIPFHHAKNPNSPNFKNLCSTSR